MSDRIVMSDRIMLSGLTAFGFHGVYEHERRDGQPFTVDVTLHLDTTPAAASDDVADTVHYGELASALAAILRGQPVDLIERLAERLARRCLADPRVEYVDVTVHKPSAPIPEQFDDVAVGISRHWSQLPPVTAVLAVGANLGDRLATLDSAIAALAAVAGLEVVAASPVVETAPVGGVPQPDYLNAVLQMRTRLRPRELLAACLAVEQQHGRIREKRWGARTLDVDVIAYDCAGQVGLSWSDADLVLPHPRAAERAFVLVPWSQLDPAARLPAGGDGGPVPVADLAARAGDVGGVRARPDLVLTVPTNDLPSPDGGQG
jgi:dihydroneopterin aldolase / 2-amino-4-hydroxy-6-hydroxymethyldihydropteridine diphosphokinase